MPYGQPWPPPEWEAPAAAPVLPPAPWDTVEADVPNDSPVPDELLQPPAPAAPEVAGYAVNPGDRVSVKTSRYTEKPKYGPYQPGPTLDDFAANMAPGQVQQERGIVEQNEGAQGIADLRETSAGQERNVMLDSMASRHAAEQRKLQVEAEAQQETAAAWQQVQAVNPARLWTDASAMQKASGLASAFIGGFLAPYNGGKNAPLETMMGMIDQDIRAQQQNQEMQRSKAYAVNRAGEAKVDGAQKFIENIDFQRAQRLEAVAKSLEQESAKFQSQITQGKFMEAIGQLRSAAGDSLNKSSMAIATFNQGQAEANDRRQEARARLSLQKQELALSKARLDAEAGKPGKNPLEGREVRDPGSGKVIGFQRVGAAGDVVKTQDKLNVTTGLADRMVKFTGLQEKVGALKTKWSNIGASADKQELLGLYYDIVGDLVRMKTGAAATAEERKAVEATWPLERFFGPDSSRTTSSFLETVENQANYDIGGFVSDEAGAPSQFGYGETLKRIKDKYGYGNKTALPDESLNTSQLKVEASRNPQEFISSMGEYTKRAHDMNDTPAGRAEIKRFQDELRKLPPEARRLPTGEQNGSVSEIDAIEALDIILQLGELEQRGFQEGRSRPKGQLPSSGRTGGTR